MISIPSLFDIQFWKVFFVLFDFYFVSFIFLLSEKYIAFPYTFRIIYFFI